MTYTPPADMNEVLALLPTAQATSTAIKSGNWSDPTTWDTPPTTDGFVWIPMGFDVVQDVNSPRLKKMLVDGCLSPADGAKITLTCETIVSGMMGCLCAPVRAMSRSWASGT